MAERCSLVYLREGQSLWLGRHTRGPLQGRYNGPGGKYDSARDGPDPRNMRPCGINETKEDSGVVLHQGDITYRARVNFYRGGRHIHDCDIYTARKNGQEWKFKDTEQMVGWKPYRITEIPWERLMPGDRLIIPLVFFGSHFEAECYYDEENKKLLDFRIPALDKE